MVNIRTPMEFFGKQPGDDRVMIHWHELCKYYREVAANADRVMLEEMGKTSEGNDFLILYVSSPENLKHLEEYRQISMQLADPRGLSQEEIDDLAKKGKAIVFQSYGLHSNEVGGPQMVPLMLYELATSQSARVQKMLKEVVFIISPCSEPDGEIVFTDWYYKYFGTEFEGICSPYLRHNWTGHANNRDALRESVVESRYLNDIIVRRFMPQIFQDHHHQCPDENRMSIAPKCDPIYPHICPLVHRETSLYGTHMALALSAAGRKGVVAGDPFFSDFPISSFYGAACLHNVAGMLTENADVRIATPDYIDPETLKLCTAREHILEPCAICPDPWEGGWWHLRDIVDQMYIASMSLLEYAADNRERILKGMAQKALYQTERGHGGTIKAYIIEQGQHDCSAAERLIEILHNQRVEMYRLKEDVIYQGCVYAKGSIYVPLAQPKYAVVQVILAEEPYSHQAQRELHESKPRLSDTANLCMSLSMGVETRKLGFEIDQSVLDTYSGAPLEWTRPLLACENESYRTVNRMLSVGKRVARNSTGDFAEWIEQEAKDLKQIRRARIGLLKVSFTGNEEEGFTRSLLRDYGFDFRIVMDKEIRESGVPTDIEIMILPADPPAKLCFGDEVPFGCPVEYQTGLGTRGSAFLKEFVARGGRLVTWEKSCNVVNEWFRLGLADKVAGLTASDYLTSSSQLNAEIAKPNHPLTWGMPHHFTLTHTNDPVMVPRDFAGRFEIIATLAKKDVLRNGIIRGEEYLAGSPCVLYTKYGKGDIVFYTFSPQFRVQQEGTYKLLFNALYKDV